MKKYIFSEKVGKKTTKYEIVAETLEEAQLQLSEKLETESGRNIIGVGLPDYVEPTDPPTDVTLKTFNITFSPDEDSEETETVTYKALSLNSAEGQFLEDFPDQAGRARETHSPLSNYAVDRENEKNLGVPLETSETSDTSLFGTAIIYIKSFTLLLFGVIGIDLLITAILGKDSSFGVLTNITNIIGTSEGLSGIVVVFLVYFLFIRNGASKTTDQK